MTIGPEEMVLRLLLATVFGGVVGIERERGHRAAGLRTHSLVGTGSALFALVSAYGFSSGNSSSANVDPTRIAAQVVSGIGFLGAGAIFFQRDSVHGLTTAASIWIVAAIGLAAGAGMFAAAAAGAVLTLMVLSALKVFERRFSGKRTDFKIVLSVESGTGVFAKILVALQSESVKPDRMVVKSISPANEVRVTLHIENDKVPAVIRTIEKLKAIPGIIEIETTSVTH